jgi:hypothetical protein
MKNIIYILGAVIFNGVLGATLGSTLGLDAMTGAVGLNVVAATIGTLIPDGVLREGVLKEVWTGEMVEQLRAGLDGSWLMGVPDASSIVDNDVIHLVDVGVDPDVLINNTTYPIPLQVLSDSDIPIGLDKFQSKVTPITDDELHALSYDKMQRVKTAHANAIQDAELTKAAHSLCATSNTAKTPVLSTTGTRDATTGRKAMTVADIVSMKAALDKLKVPAQNRRLVLCSDHVNDLLNTSQSFQQQYNIDRANGTVGRMYGFDIYEYANTPYYTVAGNKKALGATASTGEFNCSFAFYVPRTFKATGSLKMYYDDAESDPQNQQNTIAFRHYFVCMPKKADAGVVMMSAYSPS